MQTRNPDQLDLSLLGMSDIAAALGLDPYMSEIELVARLRHGVNPPRKAFVEEAGNWGRFDEGSIAKMLMLEFGRRTDVAKPPSRTRPPGRPWQRYSIDFVTGLVWEAERWQVANRDPQDVVECKLREWSSFKAQGWGEPGTDGVPHGIFLQVTGQLEAVRHDRDFWIGTEIPEREHAYVAVRVGAFDLKWYKVPYDAELGQMIAGRMEEFWRRYVEGDEVPPIDGSESARRYLDAMHPTASQEWLPCEASDHELLMGYLDAKTAAKEAERTQKLWENRLIERIGGAYGLDFGILGRIAYRPEKGRTALAKVLADLAAEFQIPSERIEALKEQHRGDGTRKFDPRLKVD